jgi:hypothetical protein
MKVVERKPTELRIWLWAVMAAYASTASAAVDFEPAVSVGVAVTDNATLVPDDPQRATVYQLFPSFGFLQNGNRIDTELDYRVEAYRYDELHESDIFQNLNAAVTAELDPDHFFFEIGATRGQTIRDPEAAIPLTNFGINANRVDRDDVYAEPSFQYNFGSTGTARGSLRRDRIQYDAAFPEVDSDAFQFSVDNYRKERGVALAFKYAADSTEVDLFEPWEYRQAGVEVGGWATPGLRLFASAGRESPWDDPRETSLDDNYWEVGFARGGDGKIAFEVAAGERTFGSSRRASLQANLGRMRTSVQYSERPSTQGLHHYRDQLVSGGEIDFLDRPAAVERFISKLLAWRLDYSMNRTTISASIYDESREQRLSLGGSALEDEAQSYVDLSAEWRAGRRTDLRAGTQKVWRQFGVVEYSLNSYYVGADYQLGRSTSLSLALTRTKGESAAATAYRLNLVTLLLSRAF